MSISHFEKTMNHLFSYLNTVIEQYPRQEKLLLVSSLTRGYQLLENIGLEGIGELNLRPVTVFDLALEILEPDILQRGLKYISDQEIIHLLEQIMISLFKNGELALCRSKHEHESKVQKYFTYINQVRSEEVACTIYPNYQFEDLASSREFGRILNEYDLTLEAGGYLDEAAVFDRAIAILQSDPTSFKEKIILIPEQLELSPKAVRFVNEVVEQAEKAIKS